MHRPIGPIRQIRIAAFNSGRSFKVAGGDSGDVFGRAAIPSVEVGLARAPLTTDLFFGDEVDVGAVGGDVHHFSGRSRVDFDVRCRLGVETVDRAHFPARDVEEVATVVGEAGPYRITPSNRQSVTITVVGHPHVQSGADLEGDGGAIFRGPLVTGVFTGHWDGVPR